MPSPLQWDKEVAEARQRGARQHVLGTSYSYEPSETWGHPASPRRSFKVVMVIPPAFLESSLLKTQAKRDEDKDPECFGLCRSTQHTFSSGVAAWGFSVTLDLMPRRERLEVA